MVSNELLSPVDGVIDPSSMNCHGSLHVNLWSHSDLIEKLMLNFVKLCNAKFLQWISWIFCNDFWNRLLLSSVFTLQYGISSICVTKLLMRFFRIWYWQGPGNDFYLGGALVIRKMKFSQFWKFLLYKTSILEEARAPPVPRPLPEHDFLETLPVKNVV